MSMEGRQPVITRSIPEESHHAQRFSTAIFRFLSTFVTLDAKCHVPESLFYGAFLH